MVLRRLTPTGTYALTSGTRNQEEWTENQGFDGEAAWPGLGK